jgi:hypothetical protein
VSCLLALLCAAAMAAPAPAAAMKNLRKAFWGPAQIDGQSAFPIYRSLGVKTYQYTVSWGTVAPQRPTNPIDSADPAYQWPSDLDAVIADAQANGMDVMIEIGQTPSWANGGKDGSWAPTDPTDAAAFFTAAARRYPAVKRWMVWGEPNDFVHWNPTPVDADGRPRETGSPLHGRDLDGPHLYAQTLDAVYAALKSVSRRNIVIGGNSWTAGTVHPLIWVRSLRLPNGQPPRMDMYGHNPFSARKPNFSNPPLAHGNADFSDLERLGKAVDKTLGQGRRHIPLWLSEWTIPTAAGSEFNYYVRESVQASWVKAGLRLARGSRYIAGIGWIHLRDDAPDQNTGVAGRRISEGLQRYDGTAKPSFAAFKRG